MKFQAVPPRRHGEHGERAGTQRREGAKAQRRATGKGANAETREALQLFRQGTDSPPFHPSLRVRNMEGHAGVWEGHVTRQYVFTFHMETDADTGEPVYVFRSIGTHEAYRRP